MLPSNKVPSMIPSRLTVCVRAKTILGLAFVVFSFASSGYTRGDDVRPEYLPLPSALEQKCLTALDAKIDFEFDHAPLRDVVEFCRDAMQIPIWIDETSLQDEGIDSSIPITISLSGVSFRSALKYLLEPSGLTHLVESEVLKITTVAVAEESQTTRVYPVGDLATTADELEQLAQAIHVATNYLSHSQEVSEHLVSVPMAKALVLQESRRVQDAALQVLRDLRQAKSLSKAVDNRLS
ncbi:MAG: hypothetical protein B7Z55_05750, partial [Planctomycetales bacterium 12-60-4]